MKFYISAAAFLLLASSTTDSVGAVRLAPESVTTLQTHAEAEAEAEFDASKQPEHRVMLGHKVAALGRVIRHMKRRGDDEIQFPTFAKKIKQYAKIEGLPIEDEDEFDSGLHKDWVHIINPDGNGTMKKGQGATREELRNAMFHYADWDGDGKLSYNNVLSLVKGVAASQDLNLLWGWKKKVKDMLNSYGDADGYLSLDEVE